MLLAVDDTFDACVVGTEDGVRRIIGVNPGGLAQYSQWCSGLS